MKIFVVSDTHGQIDKAYRIFDKTGGADLIIHCGDLKDDGKRLSDITGVPVEGVSGNCDGAYRDVKILGTPAGDILVTHGHAEGVDYDLNALLYTAEEKNCRAVCFGHTRRGKELPGRVLRPHPRQPLSGRERHIPYKSGQPYPPQRRQKRRMCGDTGG